MGLDRQSKALVRTAGAPPAMGPLADTAVEVPEQSGMESRCTVIRGRPGGTFRGRQLAVPSAAQILFAMCSSDYENEHTAAPP